jgi:hypothetical protein
MTTTTKKQAAQQELANGCITALINIMVLALLILFGWNVGVIGLIGAAGGYATTIGYLTSVGLAIALRVVTAAFKV